MQLLIWAQLMNEEKDTQDNNSEGASEIERLKNLIEDLRKEMMLKEKLATIGLMAAGIAHEINNPINFVKTSISPLQRDLEDILTLFDKYCSIDLEGDVKKALEELVKEREESDIKFVIDELHKLVDGIRDGANRTSEIVRGLRSISRQDDNKPEEIDLHANIDSTLLLLRSNYKDRIEIVKEYGDIQPFQGFPGKMNQILMNVLINAMHAISDKGIITIKTEQVNGNIKLSILDTGEGITDEIRDKIFDPFFTTKEVGKGTGLGLAITKEAMDEIGGTIEVKSEAGKGAEFILIFPEKQS